MSGRPRILALYLPQFHPTVNNDLWWGKGFTEWTNVGRARKLFPGHIQPRVPADLGYYDLRLPEVREAQAEIAHEHGIEGFCYYHYWFGNGKRELERPFNEVLLSGNPDFPFCLCWANESWYSKMWHKDGSEDRKLLVEQTYPGVEDYIQHFNVLLPAFRDKRYVCVHGKPLFMIYQPLQIPDVDQFIEVWQKLARENGLPGIYFVAHTRRVAKEAAICLRKGFNAVNSLRLNEAMRKNGAAKRLLHGIGRTILNYPRVRLYKDVYPHLIGEEEEKDHNIFPSIVPNWDHTPRSGSAGSVLHKSTPELFRLHLDQTFRLIAERESETNFVFIKSWNEWGEGNYMEPDLHHGKGFLKELKNALHDHFPNASHPPM